ncbi:MAG: radical SAM protein, partial [bacterium]
MRAEIIQDYAPCNQDCIFCNAPDIPPGLPTEKTLETVRKLLGDGVDKIILSGGEPTLRKDLPEIIRFARENGAETVELYTNAIRCDKLEYTKKLVEAGL